MDKKIINSYISKFLKKNYNIGVIQLSDEGYNRPINFYKKVSFVFRNYYHDKFSKYNKVYCFPLGYKKGFWKNNIRFKSRLANKRKYLWNFLGQVINKKTRPQMISNALKVPYGFIYTTAFWGWWDKKSMSTEEYRSTLANSTFTLSPTGWCNPDSFRLCEALEVGSIPIVEYSNGYFDKLLGENNPLPFVKKWDDFSNLIKSIRGSENKLQKKCIYWWKNHKKKLQKKIEKTIRESFHI